MPVDGVKIDRSFVADMLRDPDDLALTTAIIAMAHSLGITVVAEGVEKEGQFDDPARARLRPGAGLLAGLSDDGGRVPRGGLLTPFPLSLAAFAACPSPTRGEA